MTVGPIVDPIIRIEDAHAGYGELEILHGVSLDLPRGTLTTIIGANGAGKSTLLRLIFGTLRPRRGRVFYDGADVTVRPPESRFADGIAMVPQGRCNFPLLSVGENLRLGGLARRMPKAALAAEIDRVTARFPILRERWRTAAGNMSGGEQQVLEMAMVLINRPRLLLLDEPSLGLAPGPMTRIFEEIRQLVAEGVSVLMVEQNAAMALEASDFGVVVELGRVGLFDRADRILAHPEMRRLFLGL
jgi:branched-chain amino acid transport system ATP-binding protein